MSKSAESKGSVLSRKYKKIISDLGFPVDGAFEHYVFFQKEGYHYRLEFHPEKEGYLSLVFGIAVTVREDQRLRMFESLNVVNEKFLVVKAVYRDSALDFSCETWLYDDGIVSEFVSNSLRVIDQAFDIVSTEIGDIVFDE